MATTLTLHPDVLKELRQAFVEQIGFDPLPIASPGKEGHVKILLDDDEIDTRTLTFAQGYLSGYAIEYRTPAPPVEDTQLEQDLVELEAEAILIQRSFLSKAARLMGRVLLKVPNKSQLGARQRLESLIQKFNY